MRKFQLGDTARVRSPRRGTTAYRNYRSPVRPGRIVLIKEVRPSHHQGKCYYRIGTNHRREVLWFRSDDLLHRWEHNSVGGARKGAGRPKEIGPGRLNNHG